MHELHELNSSVNELETIKSSQKSLETNRPRLRTLLFGNNKKSPKKLDSKIKCIENIMSSSLKNESEIVYNIPEKESNENSVQPEKNISFSLRNEFNEMEESITDTKQSKKEPRKKIYKKNMFINDQAIDSLEDTDEETEPNDAHLPDDSVIDNTFDESAFNSTADMTKMYLESVKLPIKNHGFKIPERQRTYVPNVFSQAVLPDDSILEDSFINDSVQLNEEEDEIDRAEAILKDRSKKRKRRLVETSVVEVVKKRRYYIVSSDSSQDS